MKQKELKVWIELPKPVDAQHAEELCELANAMLRKLGVNSQKFSWSDHRNRYRFGGPTGYTELADRGEWFDLNYLAKGE
jgi:hypothetical protein